MTTILSGACLAGVLQDSTEVTAFVGNVTLENGKIVDVVKVGEVNEAVIPAPPASTATQKVIDCRGYYLLPGGIDPHVHLEYEQGGHKMLSADSWVSGSRAALVGGTTSVIDFVEVSGSESMLSAIEARSKLASTGYVDYSFHMSVVDASESTLSQIPEVAAAGVPSFKIYTAYDGLRVDKAGDLLAIFEKIAGSGGVAMIHAENHDALMAAIEELKREGKTSPRFAGASRPAWGEVEATTRVCALAEAAGCSIHIAHVSLADAARVIDAYAKRRGADCVCSAGDVTGEVCTHHAWLTEALYEELEHPEDLVMAPPLRSEADAAQLRDHLKEAAPSILYTCSDHCPFTREQRNGLRRTPSVVIDDKGVKRSADPEDGPPPFEHSPAFFEMPGGTASIEHRFIMTCEAVRDEDLKKMLVAAAGAVAGHAADRMGMASKGKIQVGRDADLVLVDPTLPTVCSASTSFQQLDHTLLEGLVAEFGSVSKVFRGGELCVQDRSFTPCAHGVFLPRHIN